MTIEQSTIKTCNKCLRPLPVERFSRHVGMRDGFRLDCKDCVNQRSNAYKNARREQIREEANAYYQRNKEAIAVKQKAIRPLHTAEAAAYSKEWRKRNREKLKRDKREYFKANQKRSTVKNKAWREANRAKANRHSQKWRKANPEKRRASSKANKVKRSAAPGACTALQWIAKCEFFGWKCYLCGIKLSSKTLHMEHRKPLSRGGSHWPANLAPACKKCNLAKGTQTDTEYLAKILVSH